MCLWAVGGIGAAVSPARAAPLTEVPLSPPSWSVGNWSTCSQPCGGGTQSRLVQCTRRARFASERVAASLCPQPMPSSRQACQPRSCPPAWSAGPWAEVTGAGLVWGAAAGSPPADRRAGLDLAGGGGGGSGWVRWTPRWDSAPFLPTVLPDLREGVEEEVRGL